MAKELVEIEEDDSNVGEKAARRKVELECLLKEGYEGWLNDTVVFNFMRMNLPDCMVVDPIVWNDKGFDMDRYGVPVSRSDFGLGLVLIPVWTDDHWMLAALDTQSDLLVYFDTMRNEILPSVRERLIQVTIRLMEAYGDGREVSSERIKVRSASPKMFPEQRDEDSCGPLTCMMAEAIVNHKPLKFTQKMIHDWRKETYEYLLNNDPPPVPRRCRKRKSGRSI
uniref:ULP_PROTEASE domain-containing protein n=1 Tax=Steinernema glaseri TaxID=37863 RepID=A0A1I7ZAC0_9BILA